MKLQTNIFRLDLSFEIVIAGIAIVAIAFHLAVSMLWGDRLAVGSCQWRTIPLLEFCFLVGGPASPSARGLESRSHETPGRRRPRVHSIAGRSSENAAGHALILAMKNDRGQRRCARTVQPG